jgi:hypothetical protein
MLGIKVQIDPNVMIAKDFNISFNIPVSPKDRSFKSKESTMKPQNETGLIKCTKQKSAQTVNQQIHKKHSSQQSTELSPKLILF